MQLQMAHLIQKTSRLGVRDNDCGYKPFRTKFERKAWRTGRFSSAAMICSCRFSKSCPQRSGNGAAWYP